MLIRTISIQPTSASDLTYIYFHQRGEPIESPAGTGLSIPPTKHQKGSEEVDLGIANYPPGVTLRTGPLNALLLFVVIIMD